MHLKWKHAQSSLISEAMLITKLQNDNAMQNTKPVGSPIDAITMPNSERATALDIYE